MNSLSQNPQPPATPHAAVGRRFAALARLYGGGGAARIYAAHVLVVGIGGVGSWAAEALARSGVGRLTLIDMDHIAESNINRQIHADDATIGMSKIDAMRQRILSYAPDCAVHGIDEFVQTDNCITLLQTAAQAQPIDIIIDACDQVRAKIALILAMKNSPSTLITVGAAGGKRGVQGLEIADLHTATHDPLLAKIRYQLRRNHGFARDRTMRLPCVFSREAVQSPAKAHETCAPVGAPLACAGYGSLVTVTASFGMAAAGWALDKIAAKL